VTSAQPVACICPLLHPHLHASVSARCEEEEVCVATKLPALIAALKMHPSPPYSIHIGCEWACVIHYALEWFIQAHIVNKDMENV
jgi:hypothetical protein